MSPLRGTAWDCSNFCLPQPQSPCWFLQAEAVGISLPGTGALGWWPGMGLGPLAPNIPSDFYPPHVSVGPACSMSLPLLPVLMWFILWFHSYRTSIQLNFWRLWMMVVIQLSCNFDGVVWGGKLCLPTPPSGPKVPPFSFFISLSYKLFSS